MLLIGLDQYQSWKLYCIELYCIMRTNFILILNHALTFDIIIYISYVMQLTHVKWHTTIPATTWTNAAPQVKRLYCAIAYLALHIISGVDRCSFDLLQRTEFLSLCFSRFWEIWLTTFSFVISEKSFITGCKYDTYGTNMIIFNNFFLLCLFFDGLPNAKIMFTRLQKLRANIRLA